MICFNFSVLFAQKVSSFFSLFFIPQVRLAQLTNKCGNDDLEYYIKEAGEILSVSQQLPQVIIKKYPQKIAQIKHTHFVHI